jgi:hypothetical protein
MKKGFDEPLPEALLVSRRIQRAEDVLVSAVTAWEIVVPRLQGPPVSIVTSSTYTVEGAGKSDVA